jgi:CheY-like chemotaxis protein
MIPNLLITDDDSAFRKVLCESLSGRGFMVTEACDGQEALNVLGQTKIHMALVDVHMPRVNGLQLMRHLMGTPDPPPCVLMSAKLDEQIQREAERMQAYRLMSKPFGVSELRDVVCRALEETYGWRQG